MPSYPHQSVQTNTTSAAPNDQDWLSLEGLDLAAEAKRRWDTFRLDMNQSFYFNRGQLTFVEAMGLQGKGYSHDDAQLGSGGQQQQLITVRSNKVQQLARRQLAMVVQTKPAFAPVPTNSSYKARASCTFVKKLLAYEMDRRHMARALVETGEVSQYWSEGHLFTEWDFKAGKPLDGSTPSLQPDPMLPARTNVGAPKYWIASLEDVAYDLGARDTHWPWMIIRTWARKWDLIAQYCQPSPAPVQPPEPQAPAPTGDPEMDAAGMQAHAQNMAGFQQQTQQFQEETATWQAAEDEKAKLRQKIVDLECHSEDDPSYSWNALQWQRSQWESKSDFVPVYNLVARMSPACPQGLVAKYLDADIFLWAGPLPIDQVPVTTINPGHIHGSPFGDSLCQHLAALQRTRNQLLSAVTSNLLATANPPIVYDPNDNATPQHMQSLAAIAVTRDKSGNLPKPEMLDLSPKNLPQQLEFIKLLDEEMAAIMSVSMTLQGDPQQNVRSGNMAALIVQNDLQYSSDFASAFSDAIAQQGNLLLKLYKAFGDKPMQAEIAGPGNTFQVQEFTSDDLSDVSSVSVQQGNPAARSPSFQMNILQTILQAGGPNNTLHINDIVQFLVSGNYDALLDDANDEALCIEEENELMLKAQPPPPPPPGVDPRMVPPPLPPVQAIMTDRAWVHVPKHVLACASPEIRANPAVMQAFLAHIQQHIELDLQMPPNLRLLLGGPQAPIAPPPAPPPPPTHQVPLGQLPVTVPTGANQAGGGKQIPPGHPSHQAPPQPSNGAPGAHPPPPAAKPPSK